MYKKASYFLLFTSLCFLFACVKQNAGTLASNSSEDTSSSPVVVDTPSIDEAKARVISDAIVDDVIHDRRTEVREKMEKGFREYYDEKGMGSIVDMMFDTYGKPLEAEYKKNETGRKTGSGNYDKPVRKFWYAVRTTTFEKGTHFIAVEIVPDDDKLAGSSFQIVKFLAGVPEDLK